MNDDIKHPALKVSSSALAVFGTMDWGRIAQMLAAFYTLCLITEWVWKRLLKPILQRKGKIKGRPREFLDSTGNAPLGDK